MFDSVVATYHAMNLDLLENQLHVILSEVLCVKNLARIDSLRCIDRGTHDRLSSRRFLLFSEQISQGIMDYKIRVITNDCEGV